MTKTTPVTRLDALDRRTVAALQADPRASWSQLGSAIGVSETTVMRRVQRLRDSGSLIIVAQPDALKCLLGQPVLLQFRTIPGEAPTVARYLADRADVRFVALLTGGHDVICELIAPDRHYLSQVLMFDLPATGSVLGSATEIVLKTFKTNDQWSRALLDPEQKHETPAARTAGDAPERLDDMDTRLIAALNPDARRSYTDLSHELGLSETAIARRLTALSSSGRVYFVAMVDPRALGFDLEVFLHLRVDLAMLEPTALALAAMSAVRYISASTGYSDLACEAIFRDTEALYEFVTHTLGALEGIQDVEVDVVLASVKRSFRYPLFGSQPASVLEAPPRGDKHRSATGRRTSPVKEMAINASKKRTTSARGTTRVRE